MSILTHIFTEFVDCDQRTEQEAIEYANLMKAYFDLSEQFKHQLNVEQEAMYFDIEARRNEIAALDDEYMFCYGFRVGMQTLLEVVYPQR